MDRCATSWRLVGFDFHMGNNSNNKQTNKPQVTDRKLPSTVDRCTKSWLKIGLPLSLCLSVDSQRVDPRESSENYRATIMQNLQCVCKQASNTPSTNMQMMLGWKQVQTNRYRDSSSTLSLYWPKLLLSLATLVALLGCCCSNYHIRSHANMEHRVTVDLVRQREIVNREQ